MQRASKRVHRGGQREVRVGERRTDEVAGVGRGVAALMVGVDNDVQTHQLVKGRVVHAEHLAKVGRVVDALVVRLAELAIKVGAPVDKRADLGEAGKQVHHVLIGMVPVHRLGGALGVLARENGVGLQRQDGRRQLRHGVHALREGANGGLHVRRERGARMKLGSERVDLRLGGHLTRQEQPEEALRHRLVALLARVGGQLLL
mmetsp:Transcript_17227/g.52100  ORF Transcript_17227/g.52100 Transcript_17227/m.52100 type:complete len:203 (-) Transcript_17227:314-922(-)